VLVHGDDDAQKEARDRDDLRLAALGSGSDFTPFLQHLGIPALNMGFGGEDGGGSYHSIYDSIAHYERFGDPGYVYGVVQAKTTGRVSLRLAQADRLPFSLTPVAEAIGIYADEVSKLADALRKQTAETNRRLADRTYQAAADPRQTYVAPAPKPAVPFLNFAPLQNAVARLKASAKSLDAALDAAGGTDNPALDAELRTLERALTRGDGLPGRPWYIHQIYAPGRYTGYGVKTLPAVREALEQRDFSQAEQQIGVVAQVISDYAAKLDSIAARLVH